MGIFARISRVVRSYINRLLDQAEDPEKMLDQLIVEMRDQLVVAKREVAVSIADERKLRRDAERELKQAGDWERRAVLAVREGRDDLARQALHRQKEHAGHAAELRRTWESQAHEVEKLKASLTELSERIEKAGRRRNLLIAKQKRVEAQARIQETLSELSEGSAFGAFDRMAERIEDAERRTAAVGEVSEALAGSSLEQEFAQLESGDELNERLLSLKEEMGLLPAASEGGKQPTGLPPSGGTAITEERLLEEFDRLDREAGG